MPADETDAVTFLGDAGTLYCSADVAAGAIASALVKRASAPTNEILLIAPKRKAGFIFIP